ncbi:phosphatidylserine lipase ABHD16A-like [Halichondria panicea]|uniref:phosphatidylserine lipase ABHD16A-like n=1 Tax=Halichondria panicea TaxID=6063 RepID=UPI00312B7CB7
MDNLNRLQQRSGPRQWAFIRLLQCIRGPRLRRIVNRGQGIEGEGYEPNKLEKYADNVILAVRVVFSLALYTTPLYMVYFLLRYGFPSLNGVLSTAKTVVFVPISFSLAYIIRGVGRYRNPTYREFLTTLNSSATNQADRQVTGLDGYDFELSGLPVTFRHDMSSVKPLRLTSSRKKGLMEKITSFPLSSLRWVSAHLVGRRLIYPGSLGLFNAAVSTALSVGRTKMKRIHNSIRSRLLAVDGNTIDCMFVDRRGSPDITAKGNKLVICCEGNAAFYELGMMEIPLTCGYSALGWNHPGFGDSSGLPFPAQELNAIDVVVRYAVTKLGFAFEDIVLYAWSIGGFSASCAAMSYPDIGAVVIDASFDELFPLVGTRIHPRLHWIAGGMVKEYYDLNIAEQLSRYHGPMLIIRRIGDEMMSERGLLSTNRGNYLLIKILQTRYPLIVTEETLPILWQWLEKEEETERSLVTLRVNPALCSRQLQLYMADNGPKYPWTIGNMLSLDQKKEMLLFLAGQYMSNFDATHNVGLPPDFFRVPSAGNFSLN